MLNSMAKAARAGRHKTPWTDALTPSQFKARHQNRSIYKFAHERRVNPRNTQTPRTGHSNKQISLAPDIFAQEMAHVT